MRRREHLGVHAVVATGVVGQQAGDGRGDAADARLEGAPVGDEGPHVTSDLLVHLGGHRVGQDEHGPVALDDQGQAGALIGSAFLTVVILAVGVAGVGSVLIRALGSDGAKDADAAGAFVAFIIN